jgi:ferritin-like metal-binding protein YciE
MDTTQNTTHDTLGHDERHSLQTYVSDMLSLEKHIAVPIKQQAEGNEDVAKYRDAITLISDIHAVVSRHVPALEERLEAIGGHEASAIKDAWASLLGFGASAIGSSRKTRVSKYLRDDSTALALATVSYTMLNATARGLGDAATAALAKQHLADYTPLVMRISKVLPSVVLQELADDGETVVISAAQLAEEDSNDAWDSGEQRLESSAN